MTVTVTEWWKTMSELGFSSYEASTAGPIRSVDRMAGTRRLKGRVLATRVSNRGYVLIDLTGDDGVRKTYTVHTLILRTFTGPCPDGQEARHLDDNPLNNAAANLAWGTPAQNAADKVANGNRNGPPPPRECVRCGHAVEGNGRRCHACVVWIGQAAARMLSDGTTLGDACQQLEYPSAEGLHTLAVRYGSYGQRRPRPVLWRAFVAMRDWLEFGDGE